MVVSTRARRASIGAACDHRPNRFEPCFDPGLARTGMTRRGGCEQMTRGRALRRRAADRSPARSTKGPCRRLTSSTRPGRPARRKRWSSSWRSTATASAVAASGRPSRPASARRSSWLIDSSRTVPVGCRPLRWRRAATARHNRSSAADSRRALTRRPGGARCRPTGSGPARRQRPLGRGPPRRSPGSARSGSSPTGARW